MANMTFGYARTSTKQQSTLSQVQALTDSTYDIEPTNIHVDKGVSGSVPCLERPEFSIVNGKLRSGDTLIIWWVDRLGRDYDDAKATIQLLLSRGVVIKTINQNMTFSYGGTTQDKMMTDVMLTLLVGLAAAEKENRRASQDAGRAALKASGEWSDKFKGKPANHELHEDIAALLVAGVSIRKTAEQLSCGVSTVQRVKRTMTDTAQQ